jgi:perosamine synthetase
VVRLTDLFSAEHREKIMQTLRRECIGCNNYFPPIHLQPYIADKFGHRRGDYPVCEYVADRTIALPFFGKLTRSQIERVCQVLERAIETSLMKGDSSDDPFARNTRS